MTRPDYILRGDCVSTSLCKSDKILFTGTEEGSVKVYDTEVMRPTSSWQAHDAQVMQLVQSRSGLLSQGREGAISLWKDGRRLKTTKVESTGFCSFDIADNDRHCYVGLDERAKICCLDIDTFETIRTILPSDSNKRGLCWSLKAKENLLYLGFESGDLVVFDTRLHTRQLLDLKLHNEIITAMDVRGDQVITASPDNTIKVTSIVGVPRTSEEIPAPSDTSCPVQGQTLHTIPMKCQGTSRVAVREDNRLLAASGWDGGLRLFSRKKCNLLALVPAHDPEAICDMTLDNNHVICSGRDKKISFWTFY